MDKELADELAACDTAGCSMEGAQQFAIVPLNLRDRILSALRQSEDKREPSEEAEALIYGSMDKDFERRATLAAHDGEGLLSKDDARLVLWTAIEAITIGNKTDDKLILDNLREQGVWLARFPV